MQGRIAVVLISVAFAAFRLLVDMDGLHPRAAGGFEAAAHLFVGGLFGAFAFGWAVFRKAWDVPYAWLFWTGLGLSLVELLAFAMGKLANG